MNTRYIIINAGKSRARAAFYEGNYFTWTPENVKNAFSFGKGTHTDFRRFAKDNAGNTTCIDIKTLEYIDTGAKTDITLTDITTLFSKYPQSVKRA